MEGTLLKITVNAKGKNPDDVYILKIKAISPLVEEFTKEMVAEKKNKASEFSSQNDFGDFNFSPEPIDPHPNGKNAQISDFLQVHKLEA